MNSFSEKCLKLLRPKKGKATQPAVGGRVLDVDFWREIALYTGNDDNILVDLLTEFKFKVG